MALGTTNISIRDVYTEMGKSDSSNQNLADLRFGSNDIDIATFATTSSSNNVKMSDFRSYDHRDLKFRYNAPSQIETYRDTSSTLFGSSISLNTNGTSSGDYTGTHSFDGEDDYMYWDGVNGGTAYKQNTSGYATICFWMKLEQMPDSSINILTTDLDTLGDNNPYKGYHFNLRTDGQIRPVRGDGTGASSSDRRSFGTSWQLAEGQWVMCAFVLSHNSNTANSSNNYSYMKGEGIDEEGLSYLSGGGGSTAFQNGSGSTDAMYVNTGVNSRYWNGQWGHTWVFAHQLNSTEITDLFDNSKSYYGIS